MNNEVDSIISAAEEASGLRNDPNLPYTCVPCKEILCLLLLPEYRHQCGAEWDIKYWELGDIQTVKQRQRCIICRMVLSVLLPESEITDDREEFATRTADPLYFRLRIDGSHMFLAKINYFRVSIHDHHGQIYGSIVVFRNEDTDCPLGYSNVCENKIKPRLYSRWIQECTIEHSGEPSYLTDNIQKSNNSLDLIAIDVADECLVRITTNSQYVALSYVWGDVSGLQLLVSNRTELETPGRLSLKASPGEIPPAIRSAMILVKQMNKRYLWVDRLCIEQDNQAQKYFNISHMDLIYSQALVTLLDLSSPNANEAIPGVSSSSRISLINRWTFELRSRYSNDTVRTSLRTYPANLEHTLRRSEYEKRAWTFQERLLSPRCLYFTSHMSYYLCIHGTFHCDADDLLLAEDRVERTGNNLLRAKLRPLQLGSLERMGPSWTWQSTLAEYTALVHVYSERRLSFAEDKLNAFAGVLAALMKSLPGSTVAGLPESLIDFCLLWTDVPSHGYSVERNRNFPSWSWASSNLPASYYRGPLYLHYRHESVFNNVKYNPDPTLVSKLENVGTSFETTIRPVTRIMSNTEDIQTEIKCHTKLGKDILHFDAEVCSIDQFRIGQTDQYSGNAEIHTYPEGNLCGLLYPCPWTKISDSIECADDKYDIVLLSVIKCPLCMSSMRGHHARILLHGFLTRDYCSQENCTLLHVMLIEWHENRQWAERVGIATIQGKAWEHCKRRRMRITLK